MANGGCPSYGGMASMAALTNLQARELTLGPDSVSWRYSSDPRVILTGGYVQLMHLTHPTVGAGVRDFSGYQADPFARLLRTLDYINLLTYSGPGAVEVASRVRDLHRTIKGVNPDGSRYSAMEPEAFAWVQATLINGLMIATHQLIGAGLTPADHARLYREQLGLSQLLGVKEGLLPDTWTEFETYRDDMVANRLTYTDTALEYLRVLHRPAAPKALNPVLTTAWPLLRTPGGHIVPLISLGLLPPVVRERLGVRWTGAKQAQFLAVAASLRALSPVLPERVRVSGPRMLRKRAAAIAELPFAPRPTTSATTA
jgi:uncharacterized protein (DUF2236 family)